MVLQVDSAISTERLVLRPLSARDLDDVAAYQSLEEVVRYLPWPLRNREESAEHLDLRMTFTRLEKNDDYLVLAAELPAEGDRPARVIGDLSLMLRSVDDGQAEVGWVFHPGFQGQGYAGEAAAAMIALAFGELGSHRVFARLDPRNDASARLCERLGMRREAHFVQDTFFKGEWADTLVYGILESEWISR